MKKSFTDFILIAIIIAVFVALVFSCVTKIKNIIIEKRIDTMDVLAETEPQEVIEEEKDELVVQEYEIDGNMYEVIAVLSIPSLEIEYPVFSTTSKELLKVSLNKYWGPNPNRVGNLCILGHNYNDSRFFGKLYKIEIGDEIDLTDMKGQTLQYYVYDTYIVDPDNTDCTSQLTDGKTEITLITCSRDFKQRFIVKAAAD